MTAPQLIIEADYQALVIRLERDYAESGLPEFNGDPLSKLPDWQVRAIQGIGNVIYQFGVTYDLAEMDALSELSKLVAYLSATRLPPAAFNAPILAALLAVRDARQPYAIDKSVH